MHNNGSESLSAFSDLTPDVVINVAERAYGRRLTNLCRALNSYINRVFELETEDRDGVIVKFYRPGRWSREALQDEHDFLLELAEEELPVVPPLHLADGETVGEHRGGYFALFPKRSGRAIDEPTDEEWETLGRLIARVHAVGARHAPHDRVVLTPWEATADNVDYLLRANVLPRELRDEYERTARKLIDLIDPMFATAELIRIHGDCHRGNIVYRPGESFYLIDFDDMVVGPPVHDFWMLLPDYSRKSLLEIDLFLDGYSTFREFDRRTLRLIEPLRAMRYIYFSAWCAMQIADGGFARLTPNWGTPGYWRAEIKDLHVQIDEIVAARDAVWGP